MREDDFMQDEQIDIPIDPLIQDISTTLESYALSSQYAYVSQNWNQLDNILRGVWNMLLFHLSSPTDFEQTGAYKDIYLMAEQLVHLLDSFNATKEPPKSEDEEIISKNFEPNQLQTENKLHLLPSKYDNISNFDMRFYSNFMVFTVQCLFVSGKWESIVDLISKFNKVTSNFPPKNEDQAKYIKMYLYKFLTFSEDKLYQGASAKCKDKRDELKLRVQQFNIEQQTRRNNPAKMKQAKIAEMNGEMLPEEIEFKKDKDQLEKDLFRLQVLENIIKSDKESNDEALKSIEEHYDKSKEALRSARQIYRKYSVETIKLQDQKKLYSGTQLLSGKMKAHTVFTEMVISTYVKLVSDLKSQSKTEENQNVEVRTDYSNTSKTGLSFIVRNYLTLQALNELGNLYYSDNQLEHAEKTWEEGRNMFHEEIQNEKQIIQDMGVQTTLVLICIMGKLQRL